MSYNKALVVDKQKQVIKSISDLLDVLSEIDLNPSGTSETIIADDGTEMTLDLSVGDKITKETISVTTADLNLTIISERKTKLALRQEFRDDKPTNLR